MRSVKPAQPKDSPGSSATPNSHVNGASSLRSEGRQHVARRRQEQQPRLRRVGGEADALVLAKLAVVALQDAKRRDVVELVAAKRGGAQLAHHSRLAVVQVAQPRLEDARRLGPPLPPRRLVEDVARLRDARRAEAAAALWPRRRRLRRASHARIALPVATDREQSARRRRVHVVGRRAALEQQQHRLERAAVAVPQQQRRRSLSLTAIACSITRPPGAPPPRSPPSVSCSAEYEPSRSASARSRSSRSRAPCRARRASSASRAPTAPGRPTSSRPRSPAAPPCADR